MYEVLNVYERITEKSLAHRTIWKDNEKNRNRKPQSSRESEKAVRWMRWDGFADNVDFESGVFHFSPFIQLDSRVSNNSQPCVINNCQWQCITVFFILLFIVDSTKKRLYDDLNYSLSNQRNLTKYCFKL